MPVRLSGRSTVVRSFQQTSLKLDRFRTGLLRPRLRLRGIDRRKRGYFCVGYERRACDAYNGGLAGVEVGEDARIAHHLDALLALSVFMLWRVALAASIKRARSEEDMRLSQR